MRGEILRAYVEQMLAPALSLGDVVVLYNEDLALGPASRSSEGVELGQEWLDQSPYGISQIGFVTQAIAAILPPGGRGPHCGSRSGFSTLLES